MSRATLEELHSLPGVCKEQDPATKGFVMQQTMLRIKDPEPTLDFYTRVLGMSLLTRLDFKDLGFSLYFVGYADPAGIPEDPVQRAKWMFGLPGLIELCHNHGTESDAAFTGYANGNSEPGRGFGHIGITVPSVEAACARFETLGVQFVKKPNEGKMKNLAFIRDPDGYWVEILEAANAAMFVDWDLFIQDPSSE